VPMLEPVYTAQEPNRIHTIHLISLATFSYIE